MTAGTYQASYRFYDYAGSEVILQARPADSVRDSILNLAMLKSEAAKFGLLSSPPEKVFPNGGITHHVVTGVSRQTGTDQFDPDAVVDVVILFTDYFPDALGRLYLKTDRQRAAFQQHSGIDVRELAIAPTDKKDDDAVRACQAFQMIKIMIGLDDRKQPKNRFEYPPQVPSPATQGEASGLPGWLSGREVDFAAILAKTLKEPIPEILSEAKVRDLLDLGLSYLDGKDWHDFASGKDAVKAIVAKRNPPASERPSSTNVYQGASKPSEPEDLHEAPLDVFQKALLRVKHVRSARGSTWIFTTVDGKVITMKHLAAFTDKDWDVSEWTKDGFECVLPKIPATIHKYENGLKIYEILDLPEMRAPEPPTDAIADADRLKLNALVEKTLLYPLVDVWDILDIPDCDKLDADALHMRVLAQIQHLKLPIAPHKIRYFKDSAGKPMMNMDTPIGLVIELRESHTWFKEQLGTAVYDRVFKGWKTGPQGDPAVYDIPKDDLFYVTWETTKNKHILQAAGASMAIPVEDTPEPAEKPSKPDVGDNFKTVPHVNWMDGMAANGQIIDDIPF